jgi:hypothetical protein
LPGGGFAYPALYYPPVQKEPASSFCQAVHMPYPALGHDLYCRSLQWAALLHK